MPTEGPAVASPERPEPVSRFGSADEGEGFKPCWTLPDPVAGDNLMRHSAAAFSLMRAFMDDCRSPSRAGGNGSDF